MLDDWHNNYNLAPIDGSAWVDTPRGTSRVLLGGGWGNVTDDLRVAERNLRIPIAGHQGVGGRCARNGPWKTGKEQKIRTLFAKNKSI